MLGSEPRETDSKDPCCQLTLSWHPGRESTDSELEGAVASWGSKAEDVEELRLWGKVTLLNWVSEKRQIRRRERSVGWKKFYLNRSLHDSAFIPYLQHCFFIALCRLSTLTYFLSSLQKDKGRNQTLCTTACPGLGTPSHPWSRAREKQTAASTLCTHRVSPPGTQFLGLCVPNLFL